MAEPAALVPEEPTATTTTTTTTDTSTSTSTTAESVASTSESSTSSTSSSSTTSSVSFGCPHQISNEPCVMCQGSLYSICKVKYHSLKETAGLSARETLEAVFDLFDQMIMAYKLTECDELLTEALPHCLKRGREDVFYIKGIQALAFLRFKQSRFIECSQLFEEILVLLGPSAALLENMGHAYNAVGDFNKAEVCFSKAKELIEAGGEASIKASNLGGVLLGLGLVKRHRGNAAEALPILLQALEFYQERHQEDHSLVAKAATAVARAYEDLGELDKAEDHLREVVRIFRVTCGDESPLTANALSKLGNLLWERQKWDQAEVVLMEALQRSAEVDKFSVHLPTIARDVVFLNRLFSEQRRQRDMGPAVIKYCLLAFGKVRERGEELPDDGDTAVLHKTLGELMFLCREFKSAATHLKEAERIFVKIPGPESQQLKEFCSGLLPYCDLGL